MSCQPSLVPLTSSGKCCISNLRETAEKWLWKTQKNTRELNDADADAAGDDDDVDSDDTNDIDDTDNRADDYDDYDDNDDDDE